MKTPVTLLPPAVLAALLATQTLPAREPNAADGFAHGASSPRVVFAAKGGADTSAKKDEPAPKIEGMEIARGAKGFLGLEVKGGTFKLSFYDEKKKSKKPDVVRATMRWNPNYQPNREYYVLESGDGKSLSSPQTVRPPYNFKLFLSLYVEGQDEPVESFVVDFRQ